MAFRNTLLSQLLRQLFTTPNTDMDIANILFSGTITGDEPTLVLEEARQFAERDLMEAHLSEMPNHDLIADLDSLIVRIDSTLSTRRGLDGMTLLVR